MSDYSVVFLPSAKVGLMEVVSFIAQDNPDRAESFVRELTGSLRKTLSIFPKAGRVAELPEFDMELRTLPYRDYISYYRVVESNQTVEVLYIFNGRRDVHRYLAMFGAGA